jgi:hypothetical protein
MPRRAPLLLALLVASVLPLSGCGDGGAKNQTTNTVPQKSPLDHGPRAGDFPVAAALTTKGEATFKSKGCMACHAYGKRITGPDLKGVTRRRTAAWMEAQILHPERMIREDPIARELFAKYSLQMANQGLVPEEARSIIEYLKKLDEEAEAKGELPVSR